MPNESNAEQPKKRLGKVGKVLSIVIVSAIVALLTAHFVWKYSGSGKWELVLDKNGVKIYSLKTPGSVLKKTRGVTHIKTTLNRIVATMTNTTTEGCRKFDPSCTAGEILEPLNSANLYYVQYYRSEFDPPYSPRDLVLKTQLSQDPLSKVLLVRVTALPDRLPPNPQFVRVRHCNNTWRYTPLENGEIEVEFTGDYDYGIPYFKANREGPFIVYWLLSHVEKIFNDDENRHADFAFIKQP